MLSYTVNYDNDNAQICMLTVGNSMHDILYQYITISLEATRLIVEDIQTRWSDANRGPAQVRESPHFFLSFLRFCMYYIDICIHVEQ